MTLQRPGLNVHALAFKQRDNTIDSLVGSHLFLGACSLALRTVALAVVIGGVGLGSNHTLEVTQDNPARSL